MSKHTPGPWEVAFRADGSSYISMGGPAVGQHKQFDLMLVAGSGSDEDDARLIAAAPDLLEALECMIIGACAVAVPHNGERAVLQEAVNIARAAIAKATGEKNT